MTENLKTDNSEQVRFWNDQAGPLWVASQEETDRHTGPFGRAARQAASPAEGERVLDVGCGCGTSTLALAAAVGSTGEVVGVDLSGVMLLRAEERATAAGIANVAFRRADAQSTPLDPQGFDLVFSQFGVMFFSDPPAAFANLRTALRPDGRLVFTCWQQPSANLWMALPNRAAMRFFDMEPLPHDAPGPFSLADRQQISAVLDAAGFTAIDIRAEEQSLQLGVGHGVDHWLHERLLMGPAARRYVDSAPQVQAGVRQALVDAVEPYRAADGLEMQAAAWVVIAR